MIDSNQSTSPGTKPEDKTSSKSAWISPSGENRLYALWILMGVFLAAIIGFVFHLTLAVKTYAWQYYGLTVVTGVLFLTAILSTILVLRGRVSLGVWLLLIVGEIAVAISPVLTAQLGIFYGIGIILSVLIISSLALPPRQAGAANLTGIISGMVALIAGEFLQGYQIQPPQSLSLFMTGVIIFLGLVFLLIVTRQFRYYTLLTKLFVALLFVASFSIGILAIFNYVTNLNALTTAANQSLLAAASRTAVSVDAYLNTIKNSLNFEANLPSFVDYLNLPAEQRQGSREEIEASLLLNSLQARGYVTSYSLLDRDGTVLLDTSTPNDQIRNLPPRLGLDKADPTFFNMTMLTDLPRISPVVFLDQNDQGSIFFGARIENTSGQPIGLLVSRYNAVILQPVIVDSNNLAGEGSFAVLLSEDNLRLAHGIAPNAIYSLVAPEDAPTLQKLISQQKLPSRSLDELWTDYPEFKQGLTSASHNPVFTTNELGTGDEVNEVAVAILDNRNWKIAFMQPRSIFLDPVNRQTRITILIAVFIAAVSAGAATLFARFISGPIVRLTQVAEKVSDGHFEIQAEVESADEIGRLAHAFNVMTGYLHQALENLEQRVRERTAELADASGKMEYRARQLQTVAEIAHVIASERDIEQLLPMITQVIHQRFGYYHIAIFLLDKNREYAILRAANSEGGQRMLARGHRLKIGETGLIGHATASGEPIIALDVEENEVFWGNPDLPHTRSEICLPLKLGERVTGALDVQSTLPSEFKEEDIALLNTLADQVAIAIENARLFGETRQALSELQAAQRQYLQQAWGKTAAERTPSGYRYLYGNLVPEHEKTLPELWDLLEQKGSTLFQAAPSEPGTSAITDVGSGLYVPIVLRGEVIGYINLEESEQNRSWSDDEISLVKAVSDQVAQALENARLLEETQSRAEREHLVASITTHMRSTNDPQVILKTAVEELRQALRVRAAQVILEPENTQGDHSNDVH
jgi:GAF domain-containing protein/HAMP domain-containing protein